MAIIVDRRFLQKAEELWGSEHKIIPSFCSDKLAKPVNSHPDMTILPIGETLVCCPESYSYYKEYFGDRLLCGKTELACDYPYDIAYNVLVYKNFAFCKENYTDEVVKAELEKKNIKIINVNQGYAKCSAAVCNEGIITADESIYNASVSCGINTLKITAGNVLLKGYDYGFIGGASGIVDGILNFFGDVSCHPDFEKIKNFSQCKYFDDFPLTDIGTILCI